MGIINSLRNFKDQRSEGDEENEIVLRSGEILDKATLHEFEEHDLEVEQVQRTKLYSYRVMFYKKGCDICPKWKKAIRRINMRMSDPGNRIHIVELGGLHPLYQKIQPDNAPVVYLDGIVIRGGTTTEGQVGFLEGFLGDKVNIGRSSDPSEISAISRAVQQSKKRRNTRY